MLPKKLKQRLDNGDKPKRISQGLRHFTAQEIADYKSTLEAYGYEVIHRTDGLPYNGLLSCTLKPTH